MAKKKRTFLEIEPTAKQQNKALLHKISMDLFEAGGYRQAIELIDTFIPITNYPEDIFKEYLKDYIEGTLYENQ